ncbi:MAG: TPM domain-containing protein [Bacteroidales bacterium]
MEPYIPDITNKQIIENEMIPRFKNNDYFGGLDAGTDVIMSLASGHFTADDYGKNAGKGEGMGWIVPIIIMIIVISMINRGRRGHYTSGSSSSSFWTALMLGSMLGSSHRGSFGNFQIRPSGFGVAVAASVDLAGGSFGGGGASGSW